MTSTTFDNAPSRDLTYIRLVYFWLIVGLLIAAGTAWLSLNVGGEVYTQMEEHKPQVLAPVACAWGVEHPWVTFIGVLALVAAASIFRKVRGVSALLYVAFTGTMGVVAGPALFYAQYKAAQHVTLSDNPIRESFVLTLGAFLGLTTYTWTTKSDFSGLRAILWPGLWITIFATVLAFMSGSKPFVLAVDSVVILLFCGFIVYDTQKVLQKSNGEDAIGDALNLFLDVFNIFIRLLNITSSTRSSD